MIPVRLWVFTYVSQVVMATRDGDAGTVCAAASRSHCLGPQFSLGVWRENTENIYGIQIVHKLQIGLENSITQRENQLEY